MTDYQELFTQCSLNNPASSESIQKVELDIGKKLPQQYTELLNFSNGLEGSVGEELYISIWKAEEVLKLNEDYSVKNFAPGMLLIGSDGGGEAIGIDLREESETKNHFFTVPFISNGWQDAVELGSTIEELVSKRD